MMAFFFTMPISRMIPISAMTLRSLPADQQREHGADSGGGQRGENRDGMNVALVENAQHDVDGDDRRQNQQGSLASEFWKAAAVPWKLV